MNPAQIRKYLHSIKIGKLILASLATGILSTLLALFLKRLTDVYEATLLHKSQNSPAFILLFPIAGFTMIYLLRRYIFRKKENKGITEIFESRDSKKQLLPIYKIPSHFVNGLLTVIFGGSTGIEVSTVVASAAIGSAAQRKENLFNAYKVELMCAGVAAGIAALFNSPIAGILFALEVISKGKTKKTLFLSTGLAVLTAFAIINIFDEKPLFNIAIDTWHYKAIPYLLILGVLSGANSVYLTKCVIFFKSASKKISNRYFGIVIGAVLLSVTLLLFPQLYGDGYFAVDWMFEHRNLELSLSTLTMLGGILLLKPLATALTLASGGDGGVFAPSIFLGAFLGFLAATAANTFFNAGVIPTNFMVIGMAAVLSASIQAPFTALFLVCGMVNNYNLFIPILGVCLISKYTSKFLFPYTVYTFASK